MKPARVHVPPPPEPAHTSSRAGRLGTSAPLLDCSRLHARRRRLQDPKLTRFSPASGYTEARRPARPDRAAWGLHRGLSPAEADRTRRARRRAPVGLGWAGGSADPRCRFVLHTLDDPNAAYVTLLQCVKPGYLALSIPPVMLLLGGAMAPSFDVIAARVQMRAGSIAAAAACAAAAVSTTFASTNGRRIGARFRPTRGRCSGSVRRTAPCRRLYSRSSLGHARSIREDGGVSDRVAERGR
jgi:hypothetical protein